LIGMNDMITPQVVVSNLHNNGDFFSGMIEPCRKSIFVVALQ
jgi:hypothetical protein